MTAMVLLLIAAAMVIIGITLIIGGAKKESPKAAAEEFAKVIRGCKEYDALVLDVHKEPCGSGGRKRQRVIILQIRFEQQKRTVIHKCTEAFYGRYSRGEHIRVFFREGEAEDFCILSEDNEYIKKCGVIFGRRALIWGVMLIASGILTAAAAALMM